MTAPTPAPVSRRAARAWRALALAFLLIPAAAMAAPAQSPEESSILGYWLSEKEKLIVELYPCGEEVCGRIAWMAKPYKHGELRRDVKNPDPALRDRPYCGIEVIRGLEPDGDGVWQSGKVYDPKRGDTYSLEARRDGPESLKMRAYIGIKLFGKTEIWTRPAPDHEIGCISES